MNQPNASATPSASSSDVTTGFSRRIPHAKPSDTLRGLYFNAVFNAVRTGAGEKVLREFRDSLSGDPALARRFIDFSNYPALDFLRLADSATQLLVPHVGGAANAERLIGKQNVTDFFSSMVGKTLLLLAGTSPIKGLSSLPSGYKSSVNWGEREVTILGETSARVSFRGDLMTPSHNEGSLLGMLQAMNAKNPQVRSYPKGILDCDHEVTWEK